MNEALGTVGVICPAETPLLGFFSLVLPLIGAGNAVVVVPSEKYPLITGDLYQVFETSDLPGGVVNLVPGRRSELLKVLAEHDDLDAIWCYGDAEACHRRQDFIGRESETGLDKRRARDRFL